VTWLNGHKSARKTKPKGKLASYGVLTRPVW
jgi:hypothetical protein